MISTLLESFSYSFPHITHQMKMRTNSDGLAYRYFPFFLIIIRGGSSFIIFSWPCKVCG